MAKQTLQRKNTQLNHANGNGIHHEQIEVFDDNLLPDASEIKALHSLDPGILEWLKQRAEKEQDFRHKTFETKADLVKKENGRDHVLNVLGTVMAFLIIVLGIVFSGYLISVKEVLTGTLFSGGTIILAASLFLKRKNVSVDSNKVKS